jgi:inhibitor of KinA
MFNGKAGTRSNLRFESVGDREPDAGRDHLPFHGREMDINICPEVHSCRASSCIVGRLNTLIEHCCYHDFLRHFYYRRIHLFILHPRPNVKVTDQTDQTDRSLCSMGPIQSHMVAMIIEQLGDSAFIVRDLPGPAYAYAAALFETNDPRILDVNASYETIGVYTTPGALAGEQLQEILQQLRVESPKAKRHDIPVLYDGSDLDAVAHQLDIHPSSLIELHCSREYTCFAVGFCPGYPYLGWLHGKLQGIPRLPTPRTKTEPGSVGITGKQTAIYTLATPGGWPIIGRTPLTLVDVEDNYFPIRAGDLISFEPLSSEEDFQKLKGERL